MLRKLINTHLLKYLIAKNGDTTEGLASDLGISRTALSSKINNKSEFKLSEIQRIIAKYEMKCTQVQDTFLINYK